MAAILVTILWRSVNRRLALFDSLRDAWPLYLSLACALGLGYLWHAVVFQTGLHWAVGAIVVACAALGFAVPDLGFGFMLSQNAQGRLCHSVPCRQRS